ncbi:ATP synthase subunit g, mitochondrial isoform X1 [Bombyx mori]|uniref:Uncharacterized protein n=1 Tax=Bombyx mori TaxID=7091 RepID=A0A8R1WL07_BOMMO|nr:ATP synthase subunit g, mitochondrial isoform X1 [Bombyx mori]
MAAGVNVVKLAGNLFRSKISLFQQWTEVNMPLKSKEKIKDLLQEQIENAKRSKLAEKMKTAKGFYTLEMAPPSSSEEMAKLKEDLKLFQEFMKSGCYKHLTVKQAWLLFLISTEIGLWFFLGETIGKFHIVGYQV